MANTSFFSGNINTTFEFFRKSQVKLAIPITEDTKK